MNYQTIKVRFDETFCFLQFNRPQANNTINEQFLEECHHVLALCEDKITVIIFEGLPEVFCFGADFREIHAEMAGGSIKTNDPEPLYELFLKLATGPFITIAHVRGKANAGGIGFVAASDVVLADATAQFSLSELLFGFYPACVLPFLIRRIGFQKAHYMTLMTKPIPIQQAHSWGLVDDYDSNSEYLLRKHLLRLKFLTKKGIASYKNYVNQFADSLSQVKGLAVSENKKLFSDFKNRETIFRFIETGKMPWE